MSGSLHDITKAIKEKIGYKKSGHYKCKNLDNRFKCDGGYHPFMFLRSINTSGAKKDHENRQANCDIKGIVFKDITASSKAMGITGNNFYTTADCFKLNGNIGYDTNNA